MGVKFPQKKGDWFAPRSYGFMRGACLALLLVFSASCSKGVDMPVEAARANGAKTAQAGQRQSLSAQGVAELHAIEDAAQLPGLRWPNFSSVQNEVREFYDSYGDSLPWIRSSKPTFQARSFIQILKSAETKGLRAEDYDGPRWDERLANLEASPPPQEPQMIRFDVALTVSAMRYVSDLHMGRVNPRLFHDGLDINRRKFDLSEFLRLEVVDAQDLRAVMATVEPPFPAYHRAVKALNEYIELARQDRGEPLPVPTKTIKPGNSYAGVPQLAKRLELFGDLPKQDNAVANEAVYEGSLVAGVKHFQQRHGLDPTGQIDTPTFRQLNTPLSRRVVQLQLTLERWRWLPHQFDRPPIVVNIPEFRLHANNDSYQWDFSTKVIVGKSYRYRTPVLASQLKYVIFRPYWNVPLSIQRNELLPQIEKDPAYLAKNSFEIVDRSGNVVSDGEITQQIKEQLQSGVLAIRQRPGPENSLGLVKFEFPNPYNVYMHDTPARQLFSRSRRDFSHGCIRVENPAVLATWVLRDQPEWTPENIRAAMQGEETIRVPLQHPIPVLVLYSTVVVEENGEVHFYRDIYRQDAALERALTGLYPKGD